MEQQKQLEKEGKAEFGNSFLEKGLKVLLCMQITCKSHTSFFALFHQKLDQTWPCGKFGWMSQNFRELLVRKGVERGGLGMTHGRRKGRRVAGGIKAGDEHDRTGVSGQKLWQKMGLSVKGGVCGCLVHPGPLPSIGLLPGIYLLALLEGRGGQWSLASVSTHLGSLSDL